MKDKIGARFAFSTATKSKYKDIIVAAQANFPRPGKLSRKYVEPRARTAAYWKSAVHYLIRLYNSMYTHHPQCFFVDHDRTLLDLFYVSHMDVKDLTVNCLPCFKE